MFALRRWFGSRCCRSLQPVGRRFHEFEELDREVKSPAEPTGVSCRGGGVEEGGSSTVRPDLPSKQRDAVQVRRGLRTGHCSKWETALVGNGLSVKRLKWETA